MFRKLPLAAAAAFAVAVGLSGVPTRAQPSGVKIGTLTCDVGSGWGFIVASKRSLACTYADANGSVEHYVGNIKQFGADVGYHGRGVIEWAVFAPTASLAPGGLAGDYAGVQAGASAVVGAGANVLVSGVGPTVSLQPLSVEGMTGVNFAAGIGAIKLAPAQM